MFRIFVCDDEEVFRNHMKVLLEEYLMGYVRQYEIKFFASAEELLKTNFELCDVFCLDIEFANSMNGIALAKKIRQRNYKADIIFATSHPEEAYGAFEVNTLRYLIKPIQKEQLYKTMDLILKRRKDKLAKLITLHQGQRYLQIPYAEIVYLETVDRKLRIITIHKEYLVDNKINELEKMLVDKNFFRIHKSYLVNLAFVKEHDQSSITMMNRDIVFMSRLRVKEFKECFRLYLKEEHKLG